MALKKSNIVGIALLLALAAAPVSETFANANNNLVQLDLKRSSNNSVDVTLFTSNNYNDNVLVRKKSDNKYVILIPKVQSHGYSSSSLTGVKDLVSNVDVKTVNDTNGGYTKVTLITTKPLDIKTNTQKSSPVTAEQKEYKTLIAQANAVKNNIAKPVSQPQKSVQKTEVTVNKAVQTKTVTKLQQPQNKTVKNPITKNNNQEKINITQKDTTKIANNSKVVKPDIKLKEINPEKNDRQLRKEYLAELIQETKQEKALEQAPQENLTNSNTVAGTTFNEPVKDISELPIERNLSLKEKIKNKLISFKNANLPKPIKYGLIPILGLIFLLNLIKASLIKSKELKESFIEHLAKRPPILNTVKYNNIVNNSELSWQEKYQRYLDESAKPVPRANNKGHYTFIKTPAEPVQNDKNDTLEQKRKALEQMLEETAYNSQEQINPEIVEVQNEEDAIQKTIKFKAFDSHRTSLDMTSRDKIKSRFKKYENALPLHEQKNIELGDSLLHSNRRSLKDANLKVEDVENRGIKMKFKPSEYIMSSIDEFFSIIDKEKSAKEIKQNITNPINSNNKPIPKFDIPLPKKEENVLSNTKQTNPITKLHNDTKSSYINGLIVKSGFNIDDNKGFYIVNLDGKSALIGKVNDEVFVLKKFDKNVTSPIQVRHDNANVYMVKAEGFKSLVEVNNDKMGVLIEL